MKRHDKTEMMPRSELERLVQAYFAKGGQVTKLAARTFEEIGVDDDDEDYQESSGVFTNNDAEQVSPPS
jgi:hypothetical protein